MSKIKTTNHCGVVLSSTGLDRSQYTIVFTIAMILCILAPNSGAASESTPLIDYTISASPSPEAPLVVDDDLEVKVNGETVFIDDDRYATLDGRASWKGEPITFSALPGDELEIIATNPGGGEIELSALYLHADRESVQLSDGVPNAPGGDLYEFFEERFTITIPAPSPLVYILGRPVSVHGGEDLDVKVGWSNIPEGWKLVVSLEKSETDKNRLADDIERIIRTDSGEDVFKLKVYPVNETYNQAKVWACLFDESDNWASVFTNANMTILPAQNPSPSPKPPTYPLAAAAITLGVASCMTGTDRERVAQLPDTTGMPGRVVIQRGHCVSFGAPVEQMIRLSGAEVVAVGDEERCRAEDVEAALGEDVAAVFAVESYHTVDYDGLKLHELAEVAHASGVPLLVDAATQELRLREIVAMGPDLVGCSAHKYFASTTAGIVAGRADLVAGVLAQNVGIGRGMKVGKEGILGVIAAMDTPMQTDTAAWSRAERRKVERIVERLSGVPGLEATISPDPNGCPFGRVRLTLDEGGAHTPQSLRTALAEGRRLRLAGLFPVLL